MIVIGQDEKGQLHYGNSIKIQLIDGPIFQLTGKALYWAARKFSYKIIFFMIDFDTTSMAAISTLITALSQEGSF